MGRNKEENDPDIPRSVEDDEERQMRINRNLARFLEEQTSQSRIAQQRQSYKKNKNLSVSGVKHNHSIEPQSKNLNQSYIPSSTNSPIEADLPSNSSQFPSYNKNHLSGVALQPQMKEKRCVSRDEEERQNILNNNVTSSGGNAPQMSDIKGHQENNCHNHTNKRCTMTVKKLIGRSLTFSCMIMI